MAKPPTGPDPSSLEDAEHVVLDSSPSEHIYIGSEETPNPATAGQTVARKISLNNALRGTRTELTVFAEGFAKVRQFRGKRNIDSFSLDLHYLDPVPSMTRTTAVRTLYFALGAGALGLVTLLLGYFETLRPFALPAAVVAGSIALAAIVVALYRSYERIEFTTIHGRAPVLALVANLGAIHRFRAAVPVLSQLIEEAADRIGADTSAYLRAEMREHYRLRGEGVLSPETCADSTGRILAQFDVRL